jgi:NitT/TauT family transport system substrate-binding protein
MLPSRRMFLKHLPLPLAAAALSTLPMLSACSQQPLSVAAHPWIGYETLFIARSLAWLPDTVRLHEATSATDSLALVAGTTVDAACLTLDEVLLARAQGADLAVVAVLNISAGADVVMARPDIKALADLAGRRIAVEESAVGALMLVKLLAAAGLDRSAVDVRNLPVDAHWAAWKRGDVDAVVTYEPAVSKLAEAGANRLFDSRQLPETIFDVLAVNRARLAGRSDALRELLSAHFRSLAHLRSNRQDAVYRIASRQNISVEAVMNALGGVTIPDLERNRALLAPGSNLYRAAELVNALMVKHNMLPRLDTREGLFDASYLPRGAER